MDANQINVVVWRDLTHRLEGHDDNSPPAWESQRKRRAAVKRILDKPAYSIKEVDPNNPNVEVKYLDDEEKTHEWVEFIVWLVGPVVKPIAIYIGAKIVDKLVDEVIDAAKVLIADLWEAWKKKEIGSAEVQLPNGQFIRLESDGKFNPPDVKIE